MVRVFTNIFGRKHATTICRRGPGGTIEIAAMEIWNAAAGVQESRQALQARQLQFG